MSYILRPETGKTLEDSYSGKSYVSPLTGQTECVAFLQATIPAVPQTKQWTEGKKVVMGDVTIVSGTAIATFVDGKYPGPGKDKHAAIYLKQDAVGIQVLDQWATQGKVAPRTIQWQPPASAKIQNDGKKYSVIE
jgi:hypothetical protein